MLIYKTGCLIKAAQNSEVAVIGHQANCFNTMKTGIAPQLVDAFPSVREADTATIRGDNEKLGRYSVAHDKPSDTIIYNLYGQYMYGRDKRYTDYDALRSALSNMAKHIVYSDELAFLRFDCSLKPIKVGFPKLGCGVAGGDWNIVSRIIEKRFPDSEFEVTIYTL